jgi:cytochrome c oxidase subunit 1
MSSDTTTFVDSETQSDQHVPYFKGKSGIMSWLITIDHKRIGVMYILTILSFFLVGGLFAMVVRYELLDAAPTLSATNYNKAFTLHGAIMVFLVLVPAIPASIGNFVLPLMIGAKDVAFPKLNLLSFYIYMFGALFMIWALVSGGVDTGWTFYTPYSANSSTSVIAALGGAFILGFSSILTGINFMITIHKMRAPGMTWKRIPLFLWAIYATSLIQILATPVIAITLFLLIIERYLGIGIFDPALGGDPVLFQHFFWFYSHPVVYVMVLPAFGVISETVTIHSRKHIFGYSAIAASSVAIAGVGFLVWGHHLFLSGQSELTGAIFSFITFGVAVPTAIKTCSWIATLYKGSIRWNTVMIYTLGFLWIFTIGGLTGLPLATLATDVHLHDTYFVVAHFHYVMMGGVLYALITAIHHWWPKVTGKMFKEQWTIPISIFAFISYNLTFIPQFVAGSRGMPRRYHEYLPEFESWMYMSSIGSFLFGISLVCVLLSLIHSLFWGEKAPHNPWGGVSMEWEDCATPPIEHNFVGQPICTHGPYDFEEIDTAAK